MTNFMQDFMLVFALSTDAFIAAFSLGSEKIRIPPLSAVVISVICTAILSASLLLSALVGNMLPEGVCRVFGGAILIFMGTLSLFQNLLKSALRKRQGEGKLSFHFFCFDFVIRVYLDETQADSDCSKRLSASEAAALAAALSIDSLAGGFGAGLGVISPIRIAILAAITSMAAIVSGSRIGQKVSCKKPDFSWTSGLILILLGIFKNFG